MQGRAKARKKSDWIFGGIGTISRHGRFQGCPGAGKSEGTGFLRRRKDPNSARLSAGSSEPVLVREGHATRRHAAATIANLNIASDWPATLPGKGMYDARTPVPMMRPAAVVMRKASGKSA